MDFNGPPNIYGHQCAPYIYGVGWVALPRSCDKTYHTWHHDDLLYFLEGKDVLGWERRKSLKLIKGSCHLL